MSHITGKTKREETTTAMTTFNIITWIRARRLKRVGHILRLRDSDNRLIKETLKVIYDNRQEWDILMDVDADLTWGQLQKQARDKNARRKKVNELKTTARRATAPVKRSKVTSTAPLTNVKTRFTFLPPQKPAPTKVKKKQKQNNTNARKDFYEKALRKA